LEKKEVDTFNHVVFACCNVSRNMHCTPEFNKDHRRFLKNSSHSMYGCITTNLITLANIHHSIAVSLKQINSDYCCLQMQNRDKSWKNIRLTSRTNVWHQSTYNVPRLYQTIVSAL